MIDNSPNLIIHEILLNFIIFVIVIIIVNFILMNKIVIPIQKPK